MKEYNQGDTYEEFTDDNGLPLEYEEGNEDTEAKITTLWGLPIKVVVLGGVAIFAVLLLLLLFSLRKKPEQVDPVENFQAVTIPEQTVVDTATPTSTEGMVWDVALGQYVPESSLVTEEVEVDLSSLSTEEQLTLRKLGYTGDEIAAAINAGFDVTELVEHAKALHDEESKESLKRMSDASSEEFRYLLQYSYFGQPGYEFINHSNDYFGTYEYFMDSYVVNADYVKCPTYGSQLQLKCRVAEDLEVFFVVGPERFAELPETGNIVLKITYTQYGENMYVTGIEETDGTLQSIDSSSVTREDLSVKAEDDADN